MEPRRMGVIGGSGLYQMRGVEDRQEVRITTPFGEPSDAYVLGVLDGVPVAFLSRHGRGHRHSPTEVPYRANVYGFRSVGVERLLSVSAVGSLREEIRPLDLAVPDQFFDRTRNRVATFFTGGIVGHVTFADPVCPELSAVLADAGEAAGCSVHRGGTYVCVEGPQFSTRAESEAYRSLGMDIIGMTNVTEAKLAREAELCYATLAMVCDYDCWHEGHEDVTAEMVIEVLNKSVENAQTTIRQAVSEIGPRGACDCGEALRNAILTDPSQFPPEARARLALFLDRYFDEDA